MKHAIKVLPMIFALFMLNNAHAQDAAEEKKYGFNELLCGYLEHDFEHFVQNKKIVYFCKNFCKDTHLFTNNIPNPNL